jgi:hypothetical protein
LGAVILRDVLAPAWVVVQFEKEASQTRDYCVAENTTHRAARPDPSLRKRRLFRMTTKLHHYPSRKLRDNCTRNIYNSLFLWLARETLWVFSFAP